MGLKFKYFLAVLFLFFIPKTSSASGRGTLKLHVSLDAFVYINGIRTIQKGELREFISPEIADDGSYPITLKIDYRNKNGRRRIVEKKFNLFPGKEVEVEDIEAFFMTEVPRKGS